MINKVIQKKDKINVQEKKEKYVWLAVGIHIGEKQSHNMFA